MNSADSSSCCRILIKFFEGWDVSLAKTRNSAIDDKPRDAFRGQSRSPNMLPFHMIGMVSY